MKKYTKLIITIIVAFLAATGVICVKNCYSYKLRNDAMGVRSVISKGHIDTLFVGSSAYRKGIDMHMIEEELPGESFMLTYNGNQPFNMLIELTEIINGGGDVDTIVMDFNPSMVDRGADLSDKRLLWDITMEGKDELWGELKKRDDASMFTWFDYWVSSNMDYMVTYPVAKPMISKRYYLGGGTQEDDAEGRTAVELSELEIVENPGVNTLQKDSLGEIIRICADNDIQLIFLESPRYYLMEDNVNYKAKSDELYAYITSCGVTVLRAEDLGFDNKNAGYYADLTHMSGKGCRVLTKLIIDKLGVIKNDN